MYSNLLLVIGIICCAIGIFSPALSRDQYIQMFQLGLLFFILADLKARKK